MRSRITVLATALLAASLLTSMPAQAHRTEPQPTLCEKVRAWSGQGCTSKNTRAFWKFEKDRRDRASRAGRDRSTGDIPPVLRRIRGCESGTGPTSGGNYRAENPSSSASGAYQFLDSTWRAESGLSAPASAHSPSVQDRVAVQHYRKNGTRPWNASRACWS